METSQNNGLGIIFDGTIKSTFALYSVVKVKVINESNNELPTYKNPGDAGMDIRANIQDPITLEPGKRVLVPTGIKIALPIGYEAQVRPRSGLALKNGISVLNTPGTIDSNYRGEIGVILINLGDESFTIYNGDRIAQLVIAKYESVAWNPVDQLPDSERGDGGFGHTGVK